MVAAESGNIPLVHYYISKGADMWYWGLLGAVKGNNMDLVKFFEDKSKQDNVGYIHILLLDIKSKKDEN